MRKSRTLSWLALVLVALLGAATPAHAQGKGKAKRYAVTPDRAVSVTRTVLVKQGYEVVRVERVGPSEVVYYRRGNMGRGKGKGPLERLVIRRVEDRIVFEETPSPLMVDIDVQLRL